MLQLRCKHTGPAQELHTVNYAVVTWCHAALLENGGCYKQSLLGVCHELVSVPAGLSVASVGIDVAQLPIR